MRVAYTGTSDFQEFSARDFEKAGIEAKKVRFAQGEPTEVDDEVGEALISNEGLFGGHSFMKLEDEEPEDFDEATEEDQQIARATKKTAKKAARKGSADTTGADATTQGTSDATGATSTGAGTSTSGTT